MPDHPNQSPSAPRSVRELDNALPLSEALCELVVAHHPGDAFDFARTMVLVPGGRLAHALERRLIARARAAGRPLVAPTVVTPLMFAGRFVEPERPVLSALGSLLAWRAALDRTLDRPLDPPRAPDPADGGGEEARALARILHGKDAMPARARQRAAQRLARISSEVAAAMLSIDEVAARSDASPELRARLGPLAALSARRDAMLDAAGVADRDAAMRDAVRDGRVSTGGFDRIVVLLADPEPVQRELLSTLATRGVRIEVCVHTREDLDAEGFPRAEPWESRGFPAARVRSGAIEVAEGPTESGERAVAAVRALPSPRRSDEIAVMAADDETARAVERALELAGSAAAGRESRAFAATRLGSLLARLSALVGERSMESFAAFVRHPDVARTLGFAEAGASPDAALAEYRAETVASRWDEPLVRDEWFVGRVRAATAAVLPLVQALEGSRPANEWARPIREAVRGLVGDSLDGAFALERARSVRALDRALAALAALPAGCAPNLSGSEAIETVLAQLRGEEIGGEGARDGVAVLRWLDAGLADEPHLVLAGFADGLVPEGAVADPILGDDARRRLGLASSLRRSARDAWILDSILARAATRPGATVRFIVPRRSGNGDPLRPSRFLLRVARSDLAQRVISLFPREPETSPAAGADSAARARFAVLPAISPAPYTAISVTSFRTYIACPYLFALQNDPRLRLRRVDESARELAPASFGTLLHGAVEAWAREEIDRSRRTEDAGVIAAELSERLDRIVRERFPRSTGAAVRLQVELVRKRLAWFAELQAEEARAGWRIQGVELAFTEQPSAGEHQAPLFGEGGGLRLKGRIDRVDLHDEHGWRALDYKTGAEAEDPTKSHLRALPRTPAAAGAGPRARSGAKGAAPAREWHDLQLPLYRTLLATLPGSALGGRGGGARIEVAPAGLGYVNLAPRRSACGFSFLKCSDDEAAEAEAMAAEIVGLVRAGRFTPNPAYRMRETDALAPIFGIGLRGVTVGVAAEEGT